MRDTVVKQWNDMQNLCDNILINEWLFRNNSSWDHTVVDKDNCDKYKDEKKIL